jgi:membrane protein YdbS with pleckstrin-like domain
MAYPDNLLSRGERVVLHKHPHWKVLVLPLLFFLVIIGGGSALAALLRHWKYHVIAWIAIAVIGVLLLVLLTVVPFLRWRTEHFVITNHHVFFRTGILKRRQHQIPLANVQNIETTVGFWGRLLGFGSLIVESAADQPLEFENVASLSKVQSELNQLIMDDRRGTPDDGMGDGRQNFNQPRYPQPGNPTQTDPRQGYSPQPGPQIGYPQQGNPSGGYSQQS